MSTKKDYYKILGISRGADDKEIKSAYRRLARKYHPDVNKGDADAEARFKEVAEAFAVLSDKDKRARYDRGGHDAFGSGFDPFAGADPGQFDFGFGNLGDLFNLFVNRAPGGGRGFRSTAWPQRGADLQLSLSVPFMDALLGSTVEISVPRGAGAAGERVKLRIPAGIEDGTQLRLAGKGAPGAHGAPAGDAFLTIRIEPHPVFSRDGRDLICDVPIGLATAALGGKVKVPTPAGESTINVPEGTRSNQKFRLKGKGVPSGNGRPAGDLYAIIRIHPPRTLDERSRQLMREFAELNPS